MREKYLITAILSHVIRVTPLARKRRLRPNMAKLRCDLVSVTLPPLALPDFWRRAFLI